MAGGFKQWAVGEEVLQGDFQSLLQNQVIARFPNAGARAAAITAPELNMATMLDTNPGIIDYWNGSAWVHTSGADQLIQTVPAVVYTTNAFAAVTVTLPIAYPTPPAVTVMNMTPTLPFVVIVPHDFLTTSSFLINAVRLDGSGYANSTLAFGWTAIGPRP